MPAKMAVDCEISMPSCHDVVFISDRACGTYGGFYSRRGENWRVGAVGRIVADVLDHEVLTLDLTALNEQRADAKNAPVERFACGVVVHVEDHARVYVTGPNSRDCHDGKIEHAHAYT